MVTKRRVKQYCFGAILLFLVLEFSGLKLRFYETDFSEFDYPMYGNIQRFVDEMMAGESSVRPPFADNQATKFKLVNQDKCYLELDEEGAQRKIRVVYIVKSAATHFERRKTIRKTWGFERRFADVPVRTVFLVGLGSKDTNEKLQSEYDEYQDIVQGDFIDDYYNNTIKTLFGLKWAKHHCSNARFYMFVDDDYYVSTRNVLRFLRNPANYPQYLQNPTINFDDVQQQNQAFKSRGLNQLVDFDLPQDVELYAGYVLFRRPQRHWYGKWSVSIEEYPFHYYPPYVTAGAYILSTEALKKFYFGSLFVKKYIFDDVYMGILAKKLGVEPFHSPEFWMYRKYPYKVKDFRFTVASHEFSDPEELDRVWNQQKQAGNA